MNSDLVNSHNFDRIFFKKWRYKIEDIIFKIS